MKKCCEICPRVLLILLLLRLITEAMVVRNESAIQVYLDKDKYTNINRFLYEQNGTTINIYLLHNTKII